MASEPFVPGFFAVQWQLVEQQPGEYDWRSVQPLIRAARESGTRAIWNLWRFGWPADLAIFSSAAPRRFAAFAAAFAALVRRELPGVPYYAPLWEPSYFAWAAGDAAQLPPACRGRGLELKTQLVSMALAATDAIWAVDTRARIVHVDPVINVTAAPDRPGDHAAAAAHRQAQFETWDMICGRSWPQLGGAPRYLDVLGVTYSPANQWIHAGPPIDQFHPAYRQLSELLLELHERYARPIVIAPADADGQEQAAWSRYVTREVRVATRRGVPVLGGSHPAPEARPRASRAAVTAADHPPHLCLYTDSADPSGMGEVMLTLAGLLRTTYRVSLVCAPHGGGAALLTRAQQLGITAYALPLDGPHAATAALCAWLRDQQVDIFHAHAGIGWEGLHAVYVAHGAGVPAVLRTEHLPYLLTEPQQRADHARLCHVLDTLVCVSESARQSFLAAGIPAARLRAVRNGIVVRPPVHQRQTVRATLGYAPQDLVVLTVGRMTEQKGYDLLLASVPAILDRVPRARFVWVGDGPLRAELTDAVRTAGLDHAVQSFSRRADVPDLLAAADLFVLPSRFEGLPLAALEAMAAGLPVIGTEVCGTIEAVAAGVSGALVPPERPDALAAAAIAALRDPARRAAWGQAGRVRVAREFSAARMAQEYAACYADLLVANRTRRNGARRAAREVQPARSGISD